MTLHLVRVYGEQTGGKEEEASPAACLSPVAGSDTGSTMVTVLGVPRAD